MRPAGTLRRRETLRVERLGNRGEGIVLTPQGPVYVPYALPGERIIAEVDGERGTLVDVIEAAPDRIAAFCPYFGRCGGCTVQTWAPQSYAHWKHAIVAAALARAGIAAAVEPLRDAHGQGRRRATFHARFAPPEMRVGFMQMRRHDIVGIAHCPILAPGMAGAVAAARSLAEGLAGIGKPLDIVVAATLSGLDVDLRGCGALPPDVRQGLVARAGELDLARVANHGDTIVERRAPLLRMGRASVAPPPGAFLQATLAGENRLAELVLGAAEGATRVADLFAGIGTFALRLAERAEVHAVEADKAALAALTKAGHAAAGLRTLTGEARDLFARPLTRAECDRFDAIVFDPPRAGAEAQARVLATAKTPILVAVSCNAASFARDANLLLGGGYALERVVPIDQFRHSPHVEIVGVFRRKTLPASRRRPLLG